MFLAQKLSADVGLYQLDMMQKSNLDRKSIFNDKTIILNHRSTCVANNYYSTLAECFDGVLPNVDAFPLTTLLRFFPLLDCHTNTA